jgi:hypothetical protein
MPPLYGLYFVKCKQTVGCAKIFVSFQFDDDEPQQLDV